MRNIRFIAIVWMIALTAHRADAGSTDAGQNLGPGSLSQQRSVSLEELTQPMFQRFKDSGFSLSKASSHGEEGLPAEFGFEKDIGQDTQYHADFFLRWAPTTSVFGDVLLTPTVSAEGHITSIDNTANDAWRFRAGLQYDMPLGGTLEQKNPVTGHVIRAASSNWIHLAANFKYEANRDFNVKKTMAELEITPDVPSLFIGQTAYHYYIDQRGARTGQELTPEQVQAGEPSVDFRWRPFLDVDLGATQDDGTTSASMAPPVEKEETVFRIRPRLHADLWLNFVTRALRLHSTLASVDYEYAFLPLEDADQSHQYLNASLVLGLTKSVGFSLTYSVGEQSPEFKHERKLVGALSVGF
jgi:hypothetical protein